MARTEPTVTAVINTYNDAERVGRAIRSVLNQTHRPVEVIVIDDGSTDGTEGSVRREFGNQVQYCWHSNQGIGASRNLGIGLASGEWIAFLDSDDYWAPEKLELQVAAGTAEAGVVMVGCIGLLCTPEGRIMDQLSLPQPPTTKAFRAALKRRCTLVPSGALMRRDVLQQVGGFPEDLMAAEDHVTFARVAARGEVVAAQQPLFYKTEVPGSRSLEPKFAVQDGRIAIRMCKEALGRQTWPGSWLDTVIFRQAETQLYFHAAWIYVGMSEKRKAAASIVRGIVHCPLLTMWQYRSVYWLCARLLQRPA